MADDSAAITSEVVKPSTHRREEGRIGALPGWRLIAETGSRKSAWRRWKFDWLTPKKLAGKRDQLLIATKCRFPIGYGITHKPAPHEWGLSRKAIMTACEGSLRRLKTDVIDLYQVHMQDRNVAIDETLRALDDLVTEGKVRYIGCSNYAGYSLVESLWAADRLLTHRYESIQLQWSLVQRSAERELIPAT